MERTGLRCGVRLHRSEVIVREGRRAVDKASALLASEWRDKQQLTLGKMRRSKNCGLLDFERLEQCPGSFLARYERGVKLTDLMRLLRTQASLLWQYIWKLIGL